MISYSKAVAILALTFPICDPPHPGRKTRRLAERQGFEVIRPYTGPRGSRTVVEDTLEVWWRATPELMEDRQSALEIRNIALASYAEVLESHGYVVEDAVNHLIVKEGNGT